MSYRIYLEHFEGPLDLLLQLIEEQKMDITSVSLARVAEQFIAYVQKNDKLHPEELADFLLVAAKLLLIKSRAILPVVGHEDDDEIDLEKQLKIYKEYYDAAKRIEAMIRQGHYSFSRSVVLSVASTERHFRPPHGISNEGLQSFFRAVLQRLEPFVTIPEETIIRTVTIREKLEAIRERIFREANVHFETLLAEASSRTEMIVTFLALLELVKQRLITVEQNDMFSTITIERRDPATSGMIAVSYESSEAEY